MLKYQSVSSWAVVYPQALPSLSQLPSLQVAERLASSSIGFGNPVRWAKPVTCMFPMPAYPRGSQPARRTNSTLAWSHALPGTALTQACGPYRPLMSP